MPPDHSAATLGQSAATLDQSACGDEVHIGNVEGYLAAVIRFWFADGVAAQIAGFREGLSEVLNSEHQTLNL